MTFSPPPRHRPSDITISPFSDMMAGMTGGNLSTPASGTWGAANKAFFCPMYLLEPFAVAKAYWCNGATTAVDSFDIGVYQMTDPATGRLDLLRSTGPVYSAEGANAVQGTGTLPVVGINITSGNSSTDGATFTTASVRLVKGRLYLLSVVNTAASAGAISSVDSGPTFTSRSTTQFNTAAHRTSIWSAVPVTDYIGTLVINFGGNTQTGAAWSLDEFANVDTATTDGIVQNAVGTGSSTTPLATLAAFATTKNATYAAHGNSADTTTTPATNFVELADANAATPVSCIETQWRSDNATACSATITSGPWGSCAVEIKRATTAVHWRIAKANLTSGNDSTDATTYTTASVTLKAGRLYLLSIVNTAASAAVVASIAGGPTWTSRSSTQFNTTGHRVSIWSGVPTVDYTGTVVVTYGATQTGACWVLDEQSGVDTTTNDGIVQQAVGTGNSTTTLATLAAFGSIANATYGASGFANANTVAPGTGFTELAEATAATPASRVQTEWRVDSYASVSSVGTSGQWGICAVELKADTSSFTIPASTPSNPTLYFGFAVSGNTTTLFRTTPGVTITRPAGMLTLASAFPLPSTCVPTATVATNIPLAGFSLRTLLD